MTSLPPPPTHTQVAEEWLALEPGAACTCAQCGKPFPVAGIGGPSLICPRCGFFPGRQWCQHILAGFAERRKGGEIPAPPEPAAEVVPSAAPPGLDDVIGNASAVSQIRTALEAHRARAAAGSKAAFPHVLLAGVGGVGKSMLAQIIAHEVKKPLRLQMGQSLNTPARVGDVLLSLKAGDALFVDEIAGLKPACQEALYLAMENGVYVPIGKAGKAVSPPVKLPPFTLIGATTDEWSLLPSFLQRFKYHFRLERMTPAELAMALAEYAERRKWTVTPGAAKTIAEKAHGTPRLALRLLDWAMDVALAGGSEVIDEMVVRATCELREIDALGLDKTERRYLAILDAAAGPVRVNVIASQLDTLARRTVEIKIEPVLIWMGLIEKTATGRALTTRGREHIRKGNK